MTLNFNQVKLILKDKSKKKSLFKIAKEVLVLSLAKKELAFYYGGKYLYRADRKNYKDYLSIKEFYLLKSAKFLHNFETSSLLKNKLSFALYCENNALTVPRLISYNLNRSFVFNNQIRHLDNDEKVIEFYRNVLEKTGEKGVFIKEIAAHGGKGCYLLTLQNLEESIRNQNFYLRSFVHQEIAKQHPAISEIYPHSINTIRFISHIDQEGKSHIISAFMRFGRGGNIVDNASGGGMYVAVDMEKGMLKEDAHQSMKAGGNLYFQHPDTNFIFKDFKIPYFQEACAMVFDALSYIPDGFTGWDIAITPTGPLLIEGNENPGMQTADIAYGGLLKNPVMRRIMNDIHSQK
ncbi:sugar-transfer associated ATP-grasp domain-containing protein [Flavimarina sp. Hel_I_48]|uniref:sugar-transfer associated ATP-grasp domain-containing protein n=1 Tax=Flavimarina sp. Hel_I_48 TaxID=1392488 RepID=UPI00056AA36A|nr:sugar-transfer associated ATP-grasp domain-containing protein [Flavimarina sp. Hel_I_48]